MSHLVKWSFIIIGGLMTPAVNPVLDAAPRPYEYSLQSELNRLFGGRGKLHCLARFNDAVTKCITEQDHVFRLKCIFEALQSAEKCRPGGASPLDDEYRNY